MNATGPVRSLRTVLVLVLGAAVCAMSLVGQSAPRELRAKVVAVAPDPAVSGYFIVTVGQGSRAGVTTSWTVSLVHRQLAMSYGSGSVLQVEADQARFRVRIRDLSDAQPLMEAYEAVLKGPMSGRSESSAAPPVGTAPIRASADAKLTGRWLMLNTPIVFELLEGGKLRVWQIEKSADAARSALTAVVNAEIEWEPSGKPKEVSLWEKGRDAGRIMLVNDNRLQLSVPEIEATFGPLAYRVFERLGAKDTQQIYWPSWEEQAQRLVQVAAEAKKRAIMNNLRLLAAAADQFYLEQGVNRASFDQLVGPGKYSEAVTPVDGEDYQALVFEQGRGLEVTTKGGLKVRYDP